MRRADPNPLAPSRFEVDRSWLARGALAIAVVAFVAILAKMSMMTFDRGGQRLERQERAAESGAVPAKPTTARDAQ